MQRQFQQWLLRAPVCFLTGTRQNLTSAALHAQVFTALLSKIYKRKK